MQEINGEKKTPDPAVPDRGAAKVLFGWNGGVTPQEINLATIPATELIIRL